ncbi:hypothetical protein SDRG_17254 [Saprolegnia diclina VS20]|uniref:GH18 domain-containing protein n=1 Tax=Saprolegnia diclina (strain VS20) TaxID=1156394 RepID=T0PV21_SAPDV|nr:hypothetical protein SDRG_17254 [Saprolegnia diclina VS20]EQC24855.1 hypothetical protein SDRG_17254 [Saprolegnia diclina VS20]|eukprot:XP_008621716.1 hypothetical protein SDRG_17254 [Saprolegnia diclina VS20]
MKSYLASLALALVAIVALPQADAARVVGMYYPNRPEAPRIEDVQLKASTHVFYAFVIPNADGSLPTPEGLAHFAQVVRSKGAKPVLSIGGGGQSANFPPLAASAASRNTFVQAVRSLVNKYNLEGVDIDWEFPDSDSDFNNYRVLAQQVRQALGAGKVVSAALPGWISRDQMAPIVNESLDFVNLMLYDNVYSNDGRPNAALMGDDSSVQSAVGNWLGAGVPASKLVVGVPFYGYEGKKAITYRDIKPLESSWAYSMNKASFTPQLVKGSRKITYDNPASIAAKAKFTACMNLRGVFAWEVTQDDTASSLLNALGTSYPGGNGNSDACLKKATSA